MSCTGKSSCVVFSVFCLALFHSSVVVWDHSIFQVSLSIKRAVSPISLESFILMWLIFFWEILHRGIFSIWKFFICFSIAEKAETWWSPHASVVLNLGRFCFFSQCFLYHSVVSAVVLFQHWKSGGGEGKVFAFQILFPQDHQTTQSSPLTQFPFAKLLLPARGSH